MTTAATIHAAMTHQRARTTSFPRAATIGRTLLSGGVIDGSTVVTNEGVAFDPATNAWSPLPNATNARYRGAAACELYRIGGGSSEADPSKADVELLPGHDSCGASDDVTWLDATPTEFDVLPGQLRITAGQSTERNFALESAQCR